MYAIYGNIYHQYTPVMLAYIYHTWILWVVKFTNHDSKEKQAAVGLCQPYDSPHIVTSSEALEAGCQLAEWCQGCQQMWKFCTEFMVNTCKHHGF